MTLIEVATLIGDVLTLIDGRLQTPGLDGASWHALYALRKHLNDIQRALVRAAIAQATGQYQDLTAKLKKASDDLKGTIADLKKVADTISVISQIASYADGVLKLASK